MEKGRSPVEFLLFNQRSHHYKRKIRNDLIDKEDRLFKADVNVKCNRLSSGRFQ